MKRLLFIVLILSSSFGSLLAQEGNLEAVRELRFTDFGSMKNGDELQGYFTFYIINESKKFEPDYRKQFELVLMDTEFNVTKRVDVFREKNSQLQKAIYNGSHFMFIFTQTTHRHNTHETLFYNQFGEKVGETNYASSTNGLYLANPEVGIVVTGALSIPNTGFTLLNYSMKKGFQTTISCIDHEGKELWETKRRRNRSYTSHDLLYANENFIVSTYSTKDRWLSSAIASFIQIIDAKTGHLISERKLANNLHYFSPVGAHYDELEDEVTVYGEYYEVRKNGSPNNKRKKGVFFRKQQMDGTVVSEELSSWETSINPRIEKNATTERGEKRSVAIHDVVCKKDGSYFVIGEQVTAVSTLEIAHDDFLLMDFDAEMQLQKIRVLEKLKVNAALEEGMGAVVEDKLAYILRFREIFDYEFPLILSTSEGTL